MGFFRWGEPPKDKDSANRQPSTNLRDYFNHVGTCPVTVDTSAPYWPRTVAIGDLTATNTKLLPHKLRFYMNGGSDWGNEPPTVVRHKGRSYLLDGHHRTAAAKARGARTIQARVIDVKG